MMKKRGTWPSPAPARTSSGSCTPLTPPRSSSPTTCAESLFKVGRRRHVGTIGAADPRPAGSNSPARCSVRAESAATASRRATMRHLSACNMVLRARGRTTAIECNSSGREDEDAIRHGRGAQDPLLERAGTACACAAPTRSPPRKDARARLRGPRRPGHRARARGLRPAEGPASCTREGQRRAPRGGAPT